MDGQIDDVLWPVCTLSLSHYNKKVLTINCKAHMNSLNLLRLGKNCKNYITPSKMLTSVSELVVT